MDGPKSARTARSGFPSGRMRIPAAGPAAVVLALLIAGAVPGGAGRPGPAQGSWGGRNPEREEKLRGILQSTDLRRGDDSLLRRYLYDPDTAVRLRATLAFGSLQDTTAIPDLLNNLVGAPPQVEEAAAFAIGQTASSLGAGSLAELEHDLIWARLDRTAARARLIEEIGKFGTEKALTGLMLRLGTGRSPEREPLLMAIARFAIRNVRTPEATRFALSSLLDPAGAEWQAAYALQRIGNVEGIRAEAARLIGAARHRDPLVRMHLATLFGKLKGEESLLGPLLELSRFDADWRVRVNALKALGSYRPDAEVLVAIREAVKSDNISVAITALSVLGGYSFPDRDPGAELPGLLAEVRALAAGADRGHLWQLRAEAAMTLARLLGANALSDLRTSRSDEPLLTAALIAAAGATGSPDALEALAPFLGDPDPLLRRPALEALRALSARNASDVRMRDTVYAAAVGALSSGDMAVTTTGAAILGDSLLLRRESVAPLVDALGRLRSPADIEAIQEVCATLAKIGDTSAVGALEAAMDAGDAAAGRAAAAALTSLTGRNHEAAIPRGREPLHTDFDFAMLESLPETIAVSLETSRGRIVMEWFRDAAPFTIMSMLKLADEEGFYRGLVFHRVVPNFVIQGGDPRGDGWGGPGYSLRSEFSPLTYGTGTVGIASAGKDTEGSQFFITHSPQPHLDGRYTIIGRVVSGMDVVDAIQAGDRILDLGRAD